MTTYPGGSGSAARVGAGRLFSFVVAAGTVVAFAPAVSFAGEATYSVRPGDSLWTISQRHHTTVEALRSVNSLSSTLLRPGQVLHLPGAGAAPAPAVPAGPAAKPAGPAEPVRQAATYSVRRGDSLWKIARRTGTSVAALRTANNLTGNLLHAGQVLRLSGPPPAAAPAPNPAPKPAPKAAATPTPKPAPAPAATPASYTVRRGDSLWTIARRTGTSVAALRTANNLTGNLLHTGQVLRLSGPAPAAAPAPQPAPVAAPVPVSRAQMSIPAAVAANRATAAGLAQPSAEQVRATVAAAARSRGIDPALALGLAYAESRHRQEAVSYANAIGTMQVLPSTGDWVARTMVGRPLNLFHLEDNVTAGMTFLRWLLDRLPQDQAIAAYNQGLSSVQKYGLTSISHTYVASVHRYAATFR